MDLTTAPAGNSVAPKESQLNSAFNSAFSAKESLNKSLSILEQRLSGVLRNVPRGEGQDEAKSQEFVPIAAQLRGLGLEIGRADSFVRDLINRLEI